LVGGRKIFIKKGVLPELEYISIIDFYDRVRNLASLTEAQLPNSTIDYPENAPLAESNIKELIPNWQALDVDKRGLFETAVVIQTAINCYEVYSAGELKTKQTASIKLEYKDDGRTKLTELRKRLWSVISAIKGYKHSPLLGFRVT